MFKSLIKPDPFGREYPAPRTRAPVSNHPARQPNGVSTHDWVRTLPRLRGVDECLGKILHSSATGISFVAYRMTDESASVQVVDGTDVYPPDGYHLSVSAMEMMTSDERSFVRPTSAPELQFEDIRPRIHPVAGTLVEMDYEALGVELPRAAPIKGVGMVDYLGSLPLQRYTHESMGLILHLHHLETTVVPIGFGKRNLLSAVVVESSVGRPGQVIQVSADEVRTAEQLKLEPLA